MQKDAQMGGTGRSTAAIGSQVGSAVWKLGADYACNLAVGTADHESAGIFGGDVAGLGNAGLAIIEGGEKARHRGICLAFIIVYL